MKVCRRVEPDDYGVRTDFEFSVAAGGDTTNDAPPNPPAMMEVVGRVNIGADTFLYVASGDGVIERVTGYDIADQSSNAVPGQSVTVQPNG